MTDIRKEFVEKWNKIQKGEKRWSKTEEWHNKGTNIYVVPSISFQTFFVRAFKIVVASWKFSSLLLYILWDDWPIFMISGSNEQLQQQFEYTLLKPNCHYWWISKMQSDILEERYAIKLCFKLEKKNATAFRPSCMNRASVFEWNKRFKEVREGWWEVWENIGSQYTRIYWPKG